MIPMTTFDFRVRTWMKVLIWMNVLMIQYKWTKTNRYQQRTETSAVYFAESKLEYEMEYIYTTTGISNYPFDGLNENVVRRKVVTLWYKFVFFSPLHR